MNEPTEPVPDPMKPPPPPPDYREPWRDRADFDMDVAGRPLRPGS